MGAKRQRNGDGVERGIREGEGFGIGLHEGKRNTEVRCPLFGVSQHLVREINPDSSHNRR